MPDTGVDGRAGNDRDRFREELDRIDLRVRRVIADGRERFHEGSDAYDRASMAVIRLAALFEDDDRFAGFLSTATDTERRGIVRTRNIAGHRGYAAMDDDTFWETVTVQVPAFIAKIRRANGL